MDPLLDLLIQQLPPSPSLSSLPSGLSQMEQPEQMHVTPPLPAATAAGQAAAAPPEAAAAALASLSDLPRSSTPAEPQALLQLLLGQCREQRLSDLDLGLLEALLQPQLATALTQQRGQQQQQGQPQQQQPQQGQQQFQTQRLLVPGSQSALSSSDGGLGAGNEALCEDTATVLDEEVELAKLQLLYLMRQRQLLQQQRQRQQQQQLQQG
jgi:hypothetical protein